ncbi:CAAX amino protease family protein [Streptococcus criceti]|uniref:CAAX amino terminal protease family protein n=1 Tax=Streptococcus criceti HS-6 TaxID=873449 RepID=G5JQ37_STRCG|nr:hypothetical protein STRCR_0484 [Streptococcus criceti HS-6]SUN41945.1 CAAX amino protease family protein [Streptococcus criceti]
MELFISKVISSLLEIVIFATIPFIYWFATERKHSTFLEWLGFKKVSKHDFKQVFVPLLMMTV